MENKETKKGEKTMQPHWQSVRETRNLRKRRQRIKITLIGTLILAILLLLSSCKQIEYVEVERHPITCIDEIKTPLDLVKCLNEYKQRY